MSIKRAYAAVVAATATIGIALFGFTGTASADPGVPEQSSPAAVVEVDTAADLSPEGVEEVDPGTFAASGVKYGGTITRANVIKRAQYWYNKNVPYSQSAYAWDVNHGKKYRTDCSGFVSMSLALTTSRTTSTLPAVSKKIGWGSLKAGDFVLRKGHHVVLFHKWANSAHTVMWIYEEGSTASDMNHRKVSVSSLKSDGYQPRRYTKIQ